MSNSNILYFDNEDMYTFICYFLGQQIYDQYIYLNPNFYCSNTDVFKLFLGWYIFVYYPILI